MTAMSLSALAAVIRSTQGVTDGYWMQERERVRSPAPKKPLTKKQARARTASKRQRAARRRTS